MATERIDIVITERGSRVVQRNLQDIGGTARAASGGVDFLKQALVGLSAALSVQELVRLLDTYTNLQNRLRAAGLEGQKLGAVYQQLLDVANATRASLEGTVEAYSRVAGAAKDLGISQRQLIDFTRSLNQAIALSGASATEAQAALIQLAQGLASGTLRGDELNSVMEQTPIVADVIAKELQVTRGALRKMGEDGKITADIVLRAFKNARSELEERFNKTVPTISQSFQVLKNNVTDLIGKMDEGTGISGVLSQALMLVARNLETITKAAIAAASGFLLFRGAALAINLATTAVQALTVAIASNPIGFLLAVLTAAITALTLFRDQINLGVDDITTLGDLMRAFAETVGAAFTRVWQWAQQTFGPLATLIQDWVGQMDFSLIGVLRGVASVVDGFVGAWRGAFNVIVTLFRSLPGVLADLMTQALNAVLGKIGTFVNTSGELLSPLTEFVGLGKIAAVDLKLTNENAGAAAQLGTDLGNAFSEGWNSSNFARNALDGLTARAREIAKERTRAAPAVDLDTKGKRTAPMTDPEKLKKQQKKLRDELKKLKDELSAVVGKYDSVWAAQEEVRKSTDILNKSVAAGLITRTRANEVIALMNQQLRDQLDPLGAVNRELNDQQRLLGLSADAREIESQVMSIEKDLRQQGVNLSKEELRQLRERLTLIQAETKAAEARNRVMEAVLGPQKEFAQDLQALNALLKSGAITQQQANSYLVQSQQDLFAGTSAAQDAMVAQYQQTFDRINQLRQADLISETQANQMRQQQATQMARDLLNLQLQMAQTRLEIGSGTWADAALVSLGRVQDGFTTFEAGATQALGNFFTSFTDGFANSVGRAIVYSENLGDALGNVAREAVAGLISALVKLGIQWLANAALGHSLAGTAQAASVAMSAATGTAIAAAYAPAAAMASLASFGANAAPAMSAITATTALSESLALASLAGFKEGGYTGEGGVNQVMGVVHGKEFVMNAQATAANRPLLEAMNRGAAVTPGSGGAPVNISIENYGTSKDFEVQRLAEGDIRIIARDEARSVIRNEAPSVISAEISNPNSTVSKSLARNTSTQRRR